jgi:4-alpha-glucanotransferase
MPASSFSFCPSTTYEEALRRAATLWGVEPEYWDIWGKHHVIPAGVQSKILESLGVAAGTREALDAAVEQRLYIEWSRLTPATLVISESAKLLALNLFEAEQAGRCWIEIRCESGTIDRWELSLDRVSAEAQAEIRGKRFVRKQIPIQARLKLGYHQLTVRLSSGTSASTRFIVCPDHVYRPPFLGKDRRAAGVAVSLYGLRSQRNWGCGDFTDLQGFSDWVARDVRGAFVALNPLHALANRQPYNTSPYLPACSLYRNHIYLDIERIPDFAAACGPQFLAAEAVQREIHALRNAEFVEYERVSRLKLRFLKLCFRSFLQHEYRKRTQRAQLFSQFIEDEGVSLHRYAAYMAIDDCVHRSNPDVWLWCDWPAELQDPASDGVLRFVTSHERSVLFFKYIQWQLDLQLAEEQQHAQNAGLPIGLYHDLALATDRFGCDLWANRDFYVAGCRVGAPPDDFSPTGQDWAFPPPNTERHHGDGYQLFRESIRKNARHGGALRIDHVMRFFHLFWIPDGMSAMDGAYVMDHHEDLIRVLALESVRGKFMVIGEDLGTVADFIRESLEKFGILSYRLFFFEKSRDGEVKPPKDYPKHALVSASTHDLPTLAGFWTGHDIEVRRRVGVLPDEDAQRQHQERAVERQKMLDALHKLKLLPEWFPRQARDVPELTGELHSAIIGFLASTNSELLAINQEDLFKQPNQQNLPGTTAEYPNWRNKMAFQVEELESNSYVRDCAAMARDWLVKTGRAI